MSSETPIRSSSRPRNLLLLAVDAASACGRAPLVTARLGEEPPAADAGPADGGACVEAAP